MRSPKRAVVLTLLKTKFAFICALVTAILAAMGKKRTRRGKPAPSTIQKRYANNILESGGVKREIVKICTLFSAAIGRMARTAGLGIANACTRNSPQNQKTTEQEMGTLAQGWPKISRRPPQMARVEECSSLLIMQHTAHSRIHTV